MIVNIFQIAALGFISICNGSSFTAIMPFSAFPIHRRPVHIILNIFVTQIVQQMIAPMWWLINNIAGHDNLSLFFETLSCRFRWSISYITNIIIFKTHDHIRNCNGTKDETKEEKKWKQEKEMSISFEIYGMFNSLIYRK